MSSSSPDQDQMVQDHEDFEDQGPNPETLLILGLGEDFATAVGQSQVADAALVAAELREQLASLVDQGVEAEQASTSDSVAAEVALRRRALALEAREGKVGVVNYL